MALYLDDNAKRSMRRPSGLLTHIHTQSHNHTTSQSQMRSQVEAALAKSRLGPLLYTGPLSGSTLLGAVRGRAVVVYDAGQWAGGGDER